MTHSESIAKLADALAKAQAVMEGAVKDSTNPHFRSKYADLASVWDACRKPLTAHGLSVAQFPMADGPRVTVTTILMHTSGEWVSGECSAMAKDDGPQGIGSVITYLRRYGLSAIAGVAPEDDDAEAGEARNRPAYTVSAPSSATGTHGRPQDHVTPTSGDTVTTLLKAVKTGKAGAKGELVTESGEAFLCYDQRAVALAEQCCQDGSMVILTIAKSTSGNRYVKDLKRAEPKPATTPTTAPAVMVDASSIPF